MASPSPSTLVRVVLLLLLLFVEYLSALWRRERFFFDFDTLLRSIFFSSFFVVGSKISLEECKALIDIKFEIYVEMLRASRR